MSATIKLRQIWEVAKVTKELFVMVMLVAIWGMHSATPANAGILADVAAKKAGVAAFDTGVYQLPVVIDNNGAVVIDRCVDGIRIWYAPKQTDFDPLADRIAARYHQGFRISTQFHVNCDKPEANRVRIISTHEPTAAFYDAVEGALNAGGARVTLEREE